MWSLHLINWPVLGNVLGIALYWELHCIGICIVLGIYCNWNCTILWIALHWKLYCIKICNVLEIALYWELNCIGNCIVLGIALYWELHCVGNCIVLSVLWNILETSDGRLHGNSWLLLFLFSKMGDTLTHLHTDRDCDS